jgi:hypothetical protein
LQTKKSSRISFRDVLVALGLLVQTIRIIIDFRR